MIQPRWSSLKEKFSEYSKTHSAGYIIKHAISFAVGFVLSPLSWWNDLFVNVPLAWAFAWLPLRLLSGVYPVSKTLFLAFFLSGYWLTNILGMLMMHWSGKRLISKDAKIEIAKDVLIAFVYTLVITAIFLSNPGDLLTGLRIIPSWVI